MESLMNSIKIGFEVFPVFAIIFTLPIFFAQWVHYKKINFVRMGLCYACLLYLLCFGALVFLPLPTISEAANLTTHNIQWIPFQFVKDIVRESPLKLNDVHTYFAAVTNCAVLQVVFNVLLVIPFGMFLRYYFKMSIKHIVIASFALSLFVEIAQLTGLFFVFNGSYRLCDVDDLMCNTLGGFLGAWFVSSVEKYVKEIETFDFARMDKGVCQQVRI